MKHSIFKLSFILMTIVYLASCTHSANYETDALYAPSKLSNEEFDVATDEASPTSDNSSGEEYDVIVENEFIATAQKPLSTFSVDVDRASYSNVRRFLNNGQLPPPNAVRIEEMINYFKYDYPQPTGVHPLSINTEITACPWNPENRLALVGLQGKMVDTENIPPMNLVFLIDVSGSMSSPNKLPLLKESFMMLTDRMRAEDRVAIVVYANAEGIVLNSTSGNEKAKIKAALSNLSSGGSTAGSAGISLAYQVAQDNFIAGGNNRVILATDGDFNVGPSTDGELVSLIENKRDEGIFLSILGFGMGNYKDSKMEKLADNGNGNYAYIDTRDEAKKVFVTEMSGTLYTIAKDVKLQIQFNPNYVESYRLIGYENRILKDEDFDNDEKDAGDMGAGHTVTALYEIIPASKARNQTVMDIKFRYKHPEADNSLLLQTSTIDSGQNWTNASDNLRFAAAVASFGMTLRNSKFKGNTSLEKVKSWANGAKGVDLNGYRVEFIQLIEQATELKNNETVSK